MSHGSPPERPASARAAASGDELGHLRDALLRLDAVATVLARQCVDNEPIEPDLAGQLLKLLDSAAAKVRRAT